MTDPKRLISDSRGLELSLLRAGRDDEPPAGAPRRAAVALGLAAGATATSTATTAAAAATTTKAASFGGSTLVLKTLGAVVATSILAAGVVHVVAPGALSTRVAPPVTRPAPVESRRVEFSTAASAAQTPPSLSPVIDPPAVGTNPPPPAAPASARRVSVDPPARTPRPTSVNDTGAVPPAPVHSTADEIALLDLARRALARGDSQGALRLLDELDTSYGDGAFGLESSVLRVEALDVQGQRARALELGERVLAAHPDEPVSRHLRSLVNRMRSATTNP